MQARYAAAIQRRRQMEGKTKSVKKNMVMSALLQLCSFLFPLLVFPYVSRVLLPEGLGKVSLALSVVNYFLMFAQLGIPTYGVVACARVRGDKRLLERTVQELLIINLVACLAVYAAFAAALVLVPEMRENLSLYLILSISIILNALGVEWFYQAIEEYSYITKRSVLLKLAALLLTFVLVKDRGDYLQYGFIAVFAQSASGIVNFVNLRKHISLRKTDTYRFAKHLRSMLTFMLITISVSIYTNLDSVMLGFIRGETEVGYYTVAVKIKLALVALMIAINSVLLPRVSYCCDNNMMSHVKPILRKTTRLMLCISMPLSAFFMIYAGETIEILAGSVYKQAVPAMIIIMPSLVIISVSSLYGQEVLVPMGGQRIVALGALAGGTVDFILNLVLIRYFGAAGAAFSTLTAELVVAVIIFRAVDRELLKSCFSKLGAGRIAAGTLAASAVSSVLGHYLCSSWITLFAGLPVFGAIYLVLAMRGETAEAIIRIRKRIKKI